MIKLLKKKKHKNPDTGDYLSRGEYVSWKIQGVIRNWWFVIIWTVGTLAWWIKPNWFGDTSAYVWWMNIASWLAVTVELIIGIAMFGQTKRDAMIIREIRKLERQDAIVDEMLAANLDEIKDILKRNGLK
jgi:hypothetical protein